MRAITLWQPYATVIAHGLKTYETRGRALRHRGPIAIHAAKKPIDSELKSLIDALPERVFVPKDSIPYGCILAIADMVDCVEIGAALREQQSPTEIQFGDWSDGRFAYQLVNVRRLVTPIAVTGKMGLWHWEHDDEVDVIPITDPQGIRLRPSQRRQYPMRMQIACEQPNGMDSR